MTVLCCMLVDDLRLIGKLVVGSLTKLESVDKLVIGFVTKLEVVWELVV